MPVRHIYASGSLMNSRWEIPYTTLHSTNALTQKRSAEGLVHTRERDGSDGNDSMVAQLAARVWFVPQALIVSRISRKTL
jgi:hypothetical protein